MELFSSVLMLFQLQPFAFNRYAPWPLALEQNSNDLLDTMFLWHIPTATQWLRDYFILNAKSLIEFPFSIPGSINANLYFELLVDLTMRSL